MNAGRELDRLIAAEVMGCRVKRRRDGTYDLVVPGGVDQIDFVDPEGPWSAVPAYSTDITAAFVAVEKLDLLGNGSTLTHDGGLWLVKDWTELVVASGETAPLALCRAAVERIAQDAVGEIGK